MALTKSDIVARVHELGFTKKRSVDIIETLLEIIKGNLEKAEDVLISGFGKFCVKNKKQRRGRNPSTGEDLMLRERAVVLSEDALLTPEHFSPEFSQGSEKKPMDEIINGYSLKKARKILEEKMIIKALSETGGNRTQASRLLEISHPSLLSKIKAYNISL